MSKHMADVSLLMTLTRLEAEGLARRAHHGRWRGEQSLPELRLEILGQRLRSRHSLARWRSARRRRFYVHFVLAASGLSVAYHAQRAAVIGQRPPLSADVTGM